jgi:hypothetical protein
MIKIASHLSFRLDGKKNENFKFFLIFFAAASNASNDPKGHRRGQPTTKLKPAACLA